MPAVTSMWAVAATAVATLAPTVVQMHNANMAARDARNENSRREGKQRDLENEYATRQGQENSRMEAMQSARAARQRQRALASNAAGRTGTILTSPLGEAPAGGAPGAPGAAPVTAGGKTLLGT